MATPRKKLAVKRASMRLTSCELPLKALDMSWVPEGAKRYAEIAFDSSLLDAFDMYWEMRRLPLIVNVSDDPRNRTEPCTDQGNSQGSASNETGDGHVACTDHVLATQESQVVGHKTIKPTKASSKKKADDWGESDEVEYVGVDDEKEKYNDLVSDDEAVDPDYEPDSDEDRDDLVVDDEEGCESVAHVTDVDNPKIAIDVTFEDGNCFKRCIRQYAVLKEVELAVPYSESRRYKAYCKAQRCKWRIHASRLPDGRTWQIRHMIMERIAIRKRLAEKLTGQILPSVMKTLYARSRDLGYKLYSAHKHLGEIGGTGRDLKTWRHTVDLNTRECSCRQWQITGIPCTHAIFLIISRRGLELEQFVDEYYYVAAFKRAYAGHVVPMTDKAQWAKGNIGLKLHPPLLKRSAGRPRSRRIKGVEEGGVGKRKYGCKRCGQFGHTKKTCNEPVHDPNAPPPTPPKPKRKRVKKVVLSVQDPPLQESTANV
ncbi:hypothetical protein OsI_34434 [Oryza sativa Indica Group]|uniref:SWIM-type domain-containing protein n=1 Tax=Oryza sativa subsp. indica TaxID=39946 RepID=B8BHZ5_ORYSI|nr:hypothetical protein OsI_34434 [Oryza sativa Indica Group]